MGEKRNAKYFAKPVKTIDNGPGYGAHYMIGVFTWNGTELDRETGKIVPHAEQIGEYKRNYGFLDTFHWFTKDGKDYALYSKDYTATRVMELPSCKDLGGEEPDSCGFCPVEFYVPSYVVHEFKRDPLKGTQFRMYEPGPKEFEEGEVSKPVTSLLHDPFGFVAGCVWGDDTSWKIEFIDLSEADKGILRHDDRFGYIELPGKSGLRDVIDMQGGESSRIRIAHEQSFDCKTGARFDSDLFSVKSCLVRSGWKPDAKEIKFRMAGEEQEMLSKILKKVE
jgi:hypothetical protein